MNTKESWKEWLVFSRRERNGMAVLAAALLVLIAVRWIRLQAPESGKHSPVFPLLESALPGRRDTIEHTSAFRMRRPARRDRREYPVRMSRMPKGNRAEMPARRDPGEASHFVRERAFPPASFDLNRLDSAGLLDLPGIGPRLAGRIAAFRDKLGGFVSAEQVREVWNLPPETADQVIPLLRVDSAAIRRLDLNTATWQELDAHPYLSRSQARALAAYRDRHGPFAHPGEASGCLAMDSVTWERIRPYLAAGNSGK